MESKPIQYKHNLKEKGLEDQTLTETQSGISSNRFSARTSAESAVSPVPAQINEKDDDRDVLCCGCDRPLMLIGVENSTLCYICKARPSSYVCAPCSSGLINFFDRRCAELPREIDYPYHHHALSLRYRRNAYCSGCLRRSNGFNFGCEKCKFIVDVKCALRIAEPNSCPF